MENIDIQDVNLIISDDYDKLNAKNIVKTIRNLEPQQLLSVSIHEFNTKRRKTVLSAVHSKLLKSNEALTLFNDFANLNVRNTIKSLQTLALYELWLFFLYEFNTKRRKMVLSYVQNKLSKNPNTLELMERFQKDAQEGFTILQIGETGVGKSSTINSLFGKEVAKTNSFTAETKSVTPFEGTYNSVKYTIFDTPGLGEWKNGDLQLDDKYLSLMKDQCSSPDVLWYILRLDDNRVTTGDFKILQLIRQYFGDTIWDRTMIVLTHSDRIPSPEEFQRFLEGRTETVNDLITEVTEGKIKKIPAVAVANGCECTPDGNNWLGELFTTSLERLNPGCQNVFFSAFETELKLPERKSSVLEIQIPKATEETSVSAERIELTEDQATRVKEKSASLFNVIAAGFAGAQIGANIDIISGGLTLGLGSLFGAIYGVYTATKD